MKRKRTTTRTAARTRASRVRAPRLAIVGAGRAGGALAVLLAGRGWRIEAVASRRTGRARMLAGRCGASIVTSNPALAALAAEAVIVAVPDREIPSVARSLADSMPKRRRRGGRARVALHTSGASGADALAPLREAGWSVGSFHPLMTFPETARGLSFVAGVTFATDGDAPARRLAGRLAASLGGRAIEIAAEHRPRYHLGACLASNYVVTLVAEAVEQMAAAGLTRKQALDSLLPLVEATLANLRAVGVPRALTGPVARGDAETIARHAALLKEAPRPLRELHRHIVRRTAALAASAGFLDAGEVRRVERALRG